MCFSLLGRLHTRALSLILPSLVSILFIANTNQGDYWLLFILMMIVGFMLEIGVYYWLIEYQARWLSIALAVVEFFILKWIVELPIYPLEVHLRTRQALDFYLIAWLGSWITTQALLPVMFPRWAEEGGELRWHKRTVMSTNTNPLRTNKWRSERLSIGERRRAFLQSLVTLFIITLPWSVSLWRTLPTQHFTGLLLITDWHLAELTQASLVMRGNEIISLAGIIGWIARQSFYSVLTVSNVIWSGASFMTLLGIRTFGYKTISSFKNLTGLITFAISAMCCLLIPASWLAVFASAIWLYTIFFPNFHLTTKKEIMRAITLISSSLALIVWLMVWINTFTSPLTYLTEGEWQALHWLRKTSPQIVYAPEPFAKIIPGLSGQETTRTKELATLIFSDECDTEPVFRNGEVCIVKVDNRK